MPGTGVCYKYKLYILGLIHLVTYHGPPTLIDCVVGKAKRSLGFIQRNTKPKRQRSEKERTTHWLDPSCVETAYKGADHPAARWTVNKFKSNLDHTRTLIANFGAKAARFSFFFHKIIHALVIVLLPDYIRYNNRLRMTLAPV